MIDMELPGGFQDADLEMASLTQSANRESRLRKRGICAHGWLQGLKCNYCGKVFASIDEHNEERREVLI